MINVDVSKSSREHTINLVCGDRRTSRIRIRINRYADGVDLSGLAWSVSYKNSAGAGNTDVIGVVDVCGSDLRFEWTIPDAVSAVSGISQFFVFGTDGNRKWQSDIMRINVADAMTAPAEYDEESASELDVLISNATVKVNELVSEYENIIDRIDNVIDEADTRITEVINDINSRIESGEFKGEDGNDGYTPVKNIDYFDGEDGYTPVKGVDYFTDAETQSMVDSVKDAVQPSVHELNTDIEELSDVVDGKADLSDIPDISGKLDKPSDAPTVGKVLRVKSVNADGSFVCEWAEEQALPDVPVQDVQINGTSAVVDGLANIPVGANGRYGVVKAANGTGVTINASGAVAIDPASNANIDARNVFKTITTTNLNYAVKAALTDSNAMVLDDAAKSKACETLGAEPANGDWVLKGTIVGDESDRGNIESGVTVDFSGCTEVCILCASISMSTTINVRANGVALFYKSSSGSAKKYVVNLRDTICGYSVDGKYSTDLNANPGNTVDGYDRIDGSHVASITSITFANPAGIDACDVKIYAR